jgi:hypothetical protein
VIGFDRGAAADEREHAPDDRVAGFVDGGVFDFISTHCDSLSLSCRKGSFERKLKETPVSRA